jgi:hypothetical protein
MKTVAYFKVPPCVREWSKFSSQGKGGPAPPPVGPCVVFRKKAPPPLLFPKTTVRTVTRTHRRY